MSSLGPGPIWHVTLFSALCFCILLYNLDISPLCLLTAISLANGELFIWIGVSQFCLIRAEQRLLYTSHCELGGPVLALRVYEGYWTG